MFSPKNSSFTAYFREMWLICWLHKRLDQEDEIEFIRIYVLSFSLWGLFIKMFQFNLNINCSFSLMKEVLIIKLSFLTAKLPEVSKLKHNMFTSVSFVLFNGAPVRMRKSSTHLMTNVTIVEICTIKVQDNQRRSFQVLCPILYCMYIIYIILKLQIHSN